MLENIESLLFEIRTVLLNSAIIRQLVFNDSNNALNITAPTVAQVESFITLYPTFDMNLYTDTLNTMINILVDQCIIGDIDISINGILKLNIVTNIDKWVLVDNKLRIFQIMNEIIKKINNVKFSVSNKVEFVSFSELIATNKIVGYTMFFSLTDGNSEVLDY